MPEADAVRKTVTMPGTYEWWTPAEVREAQVKAIREEIEEGV